MSESMMDTPMTAALSRFLDVNVARNRLIASNLANVDTPGYRTRDLDFRAEMARANFDPEWGGGVGESGLSLAMSAPVSRPVRGLIARPDGNNVSVERESLLLAETQMKYSLGVQLLRDEFHGMAQAINSGGGASS